MRTVSKYNGICNYSFLSFLHTSKRDHLPKKLWMPFYFFPVIHMKD